MSALPCLRPAALAPAVDALPRILFVDDEVRVLEGIENTLFDHLEKWDLQFASGGEVALARLRDEAPFDLIVTDMRMPGVDGLAVLRFTATHYPGTMRAVLSGHAELSKAMQAITIAHQYIGKPCDEAVLVATIERALHLKHVISDDQLRRVVGTLGNAAPNNAALARVRAVTSLPDANTADVALAVAGDVGLASKLLHVANSSIYGAGQVSSIATAVQRVGVDGVDALALALELYSAFPGGDRATVERVTSDAVRIAELATALCSAPEQRDFTFLCGLLHGLGSAALATHAPTRARRCLVVADKSAAPCVACERQEFGVDHAVLGAEILGLWRMPDVAQVLRYHHAPSEAPSQLTNGDGVSPLAAIHLADTALAGPSATLDATFVASLGEAGQRAWTAAQAFGEGAA